MRRVYFIKPIGMDGPIKIGCSWSPDSRRKTLETWAPFPLEIVAEVDGDTGVERRFHALFAADYQRHEWFAASPALLATIESIRAGTFDMASLPAPCNLPRKTRDNSYSTPEWRYERSVFARVEHLRRKGISTPFLDKLNIYGIHRQPPERFAALSIEIEAEIKLARSIPISACNTRASGVGR